MSTLVEGNQVFFGIVLEFLFYSFGFHRCVCMLDAKFVTRTISLFKEGCYVTQPSLMKYRMTNQTLVHRCDWNAVSPMKFKEFGGGLLANIQIVSALVRILMLYGLLS